MNRINLLIIGTTPEISGIGGVTVHVQRLMNVINESAILGIELCDYKAEGVIAQIKKIRRSKAIHIHVSNPYLKCFYVLISKIFNTKSIITLHGRYGIYTSLKNKINKLALKLCDVPILINKESYEAVKLINSSSILSPAFIRPSKEEVVLPSDVTQKIRDIKDSGRLLFVTNASSRAFSSAGEEIYGIDFLISFFKKYTEYILLILDPSNQYAPLYSDQLSENINIITRSISFSGLLSMCDAVVRNTSTDGDSFSVKEALYFRCPVLASDVVTRPEGVVLFHYNDEKSLLTAIKSLMSAKHIAVQEVTEATESYIKLYQELGLINLNE